MKDKIKVLSIGYLPKDKGGRQTTGLATGIFYLEDSINYFSDKYQVLLFATDRKILESQIDNTIVYGWNINILFKHLLTNPTVALRAAKIVYELIGYYKLFPLLKVYAKLILVNFFLEKLNPEIVHLHGSLGAILSKIIPEKGYKKILRIHGINGSSNTLKHNIKHRRLEKEITKYTFNHVTFVTSDIKRQWKMLYGDFRCSQSIALNGFKPEIFYYSNSAKEYDLISVGGISPRKGQERVLLALSDLKKSGIKLSYLIVGDGEQRYLEKLKRIIDDNRLNVEFTDYLPQKDIRELLLKSRYFIMPSESEGFGQVFIESIACGVKVILPKDLPLSKEYGVLSSLNSVFLDDHTSSSINNKLNKIEFRTPYQGMQVSESVAKLKWENIAATYTAIYSKVM